MAELIGKIIRLGEETKLTPDAMPETRMQPGKEETRGGMEAGEKRGRSSCQVIERCAPLSFAVRCKKFRIPGVPERGICVFEEYVPRSSILDEQ